MTTPRYAVDHEVLNLGEANASSWGNLGWWENTLSYATAAEQLARKLGEAVGLRAGDSVLDVGCGCGDQLVLWRREFGVGRISAIDAVASHVEMANRRIADLADAKCLLGFATQLDASASSMDKVVALDSAYHIDPKRAFLDETHRALRAGGRLGFTDLVLVDVPTSWLGKRALNAASQACEIPLDNLDTVDVLRRRVEQSGLTDVQVVDVGQHVFPGFAEFARRHRRAHLRGVPNGAWVKVIATGEACDLVWRKTWVTYVMVTATKP